jgi:branched-chain amino acid transport system substrate-binding protein
MNRLQRILRVGAFCLALAAVPCAASGEQDRNAPLRFGSLNTLSGPAQWPESSETVKAYFASINANGGIRGRRLELLVADDKGDPGEAKRAAQLLVEKQGVLAMVGSASIVDCASNADLYQRSGVMSLQGTGIEPECFKSSHVVPVNTGPFQSARNGLEFAREVLKATRPCAVLLDIPGTRAAYDAVLSGWSRERGVSLAMVERYGTAAEMDALIKRTEASRCDAVVHTGVEPHVLEWVGSAQKLGLLAEVPTGFAVQHQGPRRA